MGDANQDIKQQSVENSSSSQSSSADVPPADRTAMQKTKRNSDSQGKELNKKKVKIRPNAFISLPITSEKVKEKLEGLQKKIVENDSSLNSLMVSPDTFHLTLMVLHLEDGNLDKARATLALEECIQTISPILAVVENRLSLNKLSNFGANVVYVTMSDEKGIEAFKSAAAKVRVIYESHGLPSTDQREAKPHVTLFKTRYGKKPHKIPSQSFQALADTECGTELFNKLELCSMDLPKQSSGYYHVIHEGTLGVS